MDYTKEIICVTTDTVPGRSIGQAIGLVWGIGVTDLHGDPSAQSEAADDARHKAYANFVERAHFMGANAVVGARFDSFVAARGNRGNGSVDREYTVYGTAVVLD